jgi:hypothetical protein
VNTKKLTLAADLGEKVSEGGCEKNLSALQTPFYSNLQASPEMMWYVSADYSRVEQFFLKGIFCL